MGITEPAATVVMTICIHQEHEITLKNCFLVIERETNHLSAYFRTDRAYSQCTYNPLYPGITASMRFDNLCAQEQKMRQNRVTILCRDMYNRRSNCSHMMMKGKTTFYSKLKMPVRAICVFIILLTAISCTINIYPNPTKTVTVTVTAPAVPAVEESHTEITPPATLTEPSAIPESTTSEKKFVGSVNSNKYHLPSCEWAQKISPSNEIWFSSAEEAQAKGYVPCKVCNPR